MTAGTDCLCSHEQYAHRLGRKGCRELDCGCDQYEPLDEPAPAPAPVRLVEPEPAPAPAPVRLVEPEPEPEPELDPVDEYAARLACLARQLAVRVRDNDPADNQAWLHTELPNPADREHLLYVLAAAVPLNRSMRSLTAWAEQPRETRLQPHGTHAAAERHRYHEEPLCDPCRDAERVRDRPRAAAYRAAQKPSTIRRTRETTAA